MSKKENKYLILAVASIAVVVLLSFLFQIMIAVIVGLVTAAIGYYIIKSMKADEVDIVPEMDEPNVVDEHIEVLLNTNLLLRKVMIPLEVRDAFEKTIDQLLMLLPKVNDAAAESELAWVINRMATEYLPEKSIKPYLALDSSRRNSKEIIKSVMDGLVSINTELSEVEGVLLNRKVNEFNAKAKFLKQRFNI